MTVRERLLIIRLSENISHQPGYANRIGISIEDTDNFHNTLKNVSTTKERRSQWEEKERTMMNMMSTSTVKEKSKSTMTAIH